MTSWHSLRVNVSVDSPLEAEHKRINDKEIILLPIINNYDK